MSGLVSASAEIARAKPSRPPSEGEARPLHKDDHLPALDGLRGAAVLLVILHHSLLGWKPARTAAEAWLEKIVGHGWIGVDLFFVLSGFLITGILLDTRGRSGYFRSFYPRRMLRTFPLYYATLAVCFLLLPWAMPAEVRSLADHQAWFWLHVSNFTAASGWMATFWSLAVEEHFYLVWPVVVLACPPRLLAPACALLLVLVLGLRMALASAGGEFETIYRLTFTRLDGLLFGSLVAAFSRQGSGLARLAIPARILLPAAGLMLAALALAGGGHRSFTGRTALFTLVALFFASLMVCVLRPAGPSFLASVFSLPPLRLCGRYSYSMYIFNIPLLHLLALGLDPDRLLLFGSRIPAILIYAAVGMALSLGAAWITWHLLEKHCLKLKRHFIVGS